MKITGIGKWVSPAGLFGAVLERKAGFQTIDYGRRIKGKIGTNRLRDDKRSRSDLYLSYITSTVRSSNCVELLNSIIIYYNLVVQETKASEITAAETILIYKLNYAKKKLSVKYFETYFY